MSKITNKQFSSKQIGTHDSK